jgi:crotonobetaine/carnitine-CoA ligase
MTSTWQAGSDETIVSVLDSAVAKWGDRPYLDFGGTLYSFASIDAAARRLASGLARHGVGKGDRVATILDNNVDAVLAWFAINRLGAISVPVNTAYKGEFLRHQIADSGAAVVLAETDYAERVIAVADGLPALAILAYRGDLPPPDAPAGLSLVALDTIKEDIGSLPEVRVAPGDLAMLIYTSGTTGPSKGCMISHHYACNLARQYIRSSALGKDDILWTALPLFHMNATATTVLSTAMIGSRAVIYPRFSVSGFWPDIRRSGATMANMLGSMAPLLADAPDHPDGIACFGQIRLVNSAPFPGNLQDRWRARFGVRDMGSAGYGLTEAAMVVTSRIGQDCPPGAAGLRNDDFEVIIVDDYDVPVAPGESGEVLIRPKRPHVMFEGYWNRPEATLAILRNLWLHTGDIGRFDENDFFYFVDRKKDYLRRRGENISSFEMEASFLSHPAIRDVAVHAVFSELGEDDVKVTAVLTDDAALTEQDLCLWAIDRVPYFAVPRYIEFRDDLPRNPTGKVLKYQLRDEGCTPLTWDREKTDMALAKR